MKKFTTFCLAAAVAGTAFAQRPTTATTAVATKAQLTNTANYESRLAMMEQIRRADVDHTTMARPLGQPLPVQPNGKTASVTAVPLGSASNAFTVLTTEQNQVYANEATDLVTFIHRNDASIFGGSSGNLRYDFSTDGGTSFTNNIGNLNPLLSRPARYPNVTGVIGDGVTNPFDGKLAFYAATLDPSPDWDGHLAGVTNITTGGPSVTENYLRIGEGAYIPVSLTKGLAGEYWATDREYAAATFTGSFFVNKGTWNSTTNDVDWVRVDTVTPDNSVSFDGNSRIIGPQIAFSPDGSVGWVVWLGDLNDGPDSTYAPIVMRTTDNGATWSAPKELVINDVPWVYDTLRTLWVDSTSQPASSGRATCAFDFDITVDVNGHAHVAAVIGSSNGPGDTPGYSIMSGIAKFMGDFVIENDSMWDLKYISPVLTFRTPDFGTTTVANMDNNTQVSRSPNGNYVFYSWADSDTAQFTGSMNGIGFGESDNLAPNLRIAGMNVITGEQSYPQLVSDGDLLWEGAVLWPTMAPIALDNGGGCYELPIVVTAMTNSDPTQPASFFYFGNDAIICGADMCDPSSMALSWGTFAFGGATPPCAVGVDQVAENNIVLGQSFPNPTSGEAVITFELPVASEVTMTLSNMFGQQVATLANGAYAAGSHKAVVNTTDLAAGIYFYTLQAEGAAVTKKMIVTK